MYTRIPKPGAPPRESATEYTPADPPPALPAAAAAVLPVLAWRAGAAPARVSRYRLTSAMLATVIENALGF